MGKKESPRWSICLTWRIWLRNLWKVGSWLIFIRLRPCVGDDEGRNETCHVIDGPQSWKVIAPLSIFLYRLLCHYKESNMNIFIKSDEIRKRAVDLSETIWQLRVAIFVCRPWTIEMNPVNISLFSHASEHVKCQILKERSTGIC